MIRIDYIDGKFICRVSFAEREIAKKAGFRFSVENRCWYTPFPSVASRLREYATDTAKLEMDKVLLTRSPWSGKPPSEYTPPNLSLKPYQVEPTLFIVERNRTYIALDPGLGKTIVAATATNMLSGWVVLYLCPPFLARTAEAEFKVWAPKKTVTRFDPKSEFTPIKQNDFQNQVYILPDSIITRKQVLEFIAKSFRFLRHKAMLIVDEAHRYKNPDAKRTQKLFGNNMGKGITKEGIVSLFEKVVLMSGTPMQNRPMELHNTLFKLAPETIDYMGKHNFGVEYCKAQLIDGYWDYSGSSNLKKLQKRVIYPSGPFMYRLKKDVLDLPPKIESILIVNGDMSNKAGNYSRKILAKLAPEDIVKAQIAERNELFEGELHLATYRRLLAIEKVPYTVEIVKDILDAGESLLLFAIHKQAIEQLTEALSKYNPLVITGKTPNQKRHEHVAAFQNPKLKHKLFIGQIDACGVGLTLTKAQRVLFHEASWVPAVNKQASDRAHRIGQKGSVFVQYLVFDGSVDKAVMEMNLKKEDSTKYI